MIYVMLLSVIATSFFASMALIKPTQAEVGTHKITVVYYQAKVHNDHDTDLPFFKNKGEWKFGLRTETQGYVEVPQSQYVYYQVDNGQTVNFPDITLSWIHGVPTWFRMRAQEYDAFIDIDGGIIPPTWVDYTSEIQINVDFSKPVNQWISGSYKKGDVTHYYRYNIENKNPTANSIQDQDVLFGTAVSFLGSGLDPEGDSITYHWNFGDGETSTAQNPTHTYADVGTYVVSFRVRDYFGAYSDYKYATVNVLPYVVIDQAFVSDNRCNVESLQSVGFHAKWIPDDTDVDGGDIYVNGIEYVTNATGWITLDVTNDTVGENTWTVTGVNATGVTDYQQLVDSPSIIWDRVNVTLSVEDGTLEVGETANITHTAVYEYDNTDFDGQITLNDTLTKMTGGTFHYTTESIANDAYGITVFESNTVAVTFVDLISPVADAGDDQTVKVDEEVEFDASASTDNVDIVSYEWDFGDGSTGTGETPTHTYTEPGVYTVTLTVKDAEGNSDTDSITVTVEGVPTVFPWWILGVVGAVIAGIVVTALLLWRRKASKGP